jgi:hypothetical protein
MVDWERGGILWRQGHFLTEDAAVNLKLVSPEKKGMEIPIVISHDCDISNKPKVEPYIEVIVGIRINAVDGNCTHSKNPRILHILAKQGDTDVCLELSATDKRLTRAMPATQTNILMERCRALYKMILSP